MIEFMREESEEYYLGIINLHVPVRCYSNEYLNKIVRHRLDINKVGSFYELNIYG